MAQIVLNSYPPSTSSVQQGTIPADWSVPAASVEVVGPGGAGAARNSTTVGGPGGAGGAYAKKTSLSDLGLNPGDIYYYRLCTGGTPSAAAVDCFFETANLMRATNAMTASPWTLSSCTGTSGQADPSGGAGAFKFLSSVTTSVLHYVQFANHAYASASTIEMIFAVYVKPIGSSVGSIILNYNDGANGANATLNIATGATIGTGGSGAWSTISCGADTDDWATGASGNGWYRIWMICSLPSLASSTPTAMYFQMADSGGNGTQTLTTSDGYYLFMPTWNFGRVKRRYANTSTSTPLYYALAKAGGNATTAAAGTCPTGSIGDTTFQGGGGFKATSTQSGAGGGGGGAAGPNGAGATATGIPGGAADNNTVTGGAQNTAGNSGAEWSVTVGCGSGGGGAAATGGVSPAPSGGSYGGGGGGADKTSGHTGGVGGNGLIVITYTPAVALYVGPQRLRQYLRR